MKRIFFALMLLVVATVTMNAQDETEQTAAPSFDVSMMAQVFDAHQFDDDYREIYVQNDFFVSIINSDDAEATIYYRVVEGYGPEEWTVYNEYEPVCCYAVSDYTSYVIEAYAQADGKQPSDVVSTADLEDVAITPTINFEYSACVVDGINYYFMNEAGFPYSATAVMVCSEGHPMFAADSYYAGEITIPEEIVFWDETYSVVGIHDNAFYHCGVTSVDIPNTVLSVGSMAFFDCRDLAKVICRSINPPYAYYSFEGDYDAQDIIYRNATLYVPAESLEAYKAHEEWGKFSHIVTFIGAGPGDVDGDGAIGIDDVTSLIDQLLNGEELPAYVDVDGDGTVDISDVTELIDMLLGVN